MFGLVIFLLIILIMNVFENRRLSCAVSEYESTLYKREFSESYTRLTRYIDRNVKRLRSYNNNGYYIVLADDNNRSAGFLNIYMEKVSVDTMDFFAEGEDALSRYEIAALYNYTKCLYETVRLDKLTESLDRLDLVSEEYKEEYKNE